MARATFLAHGQRSGAVCVLVADNDRLQELNRQFRGLDEPTDVLTFPPPENMKPHLGDIAVNRQMALEAGKRPGWSETAELGQLVAHGCLHLLGYEDDDEAARVHMVRIANEALAHLGMPTDPDWRSIEH
ncbi:MAG: rRNA maturation RNase YbeY [Fimbriimonadaceae bacterium]|nr:rRNA maturation RNase YbeY [Fimbriimonadaceae bacterium]QYK58223.1 MAG: rRNA maturation RNase YbeY [Fimbriimonadaceae bacterium]